MWDEDDTEPKHQAQICRNGHVIGELVESYPGTRKKRCPECGAPTIDSCESCGTPIQGAEGGLSVINKYVRPKFCEECGEPYPWTSAAMEGSREKIDLLSGLSKEERERLKADLPDLTTDTPRTDVATLRLKAILDRLSGPTAIVVRETVTSIVSDVVKKTLGL